MLDVHCIMRRTLANEYIGALSSMEQKGVGRVCCGLGTMFRVAMEPECEKKGQCLSLYKSNLYHSGTGSRGFSSGAEGNNIRHFIFSSQHIRLK